MSGDVTDFDDKLEGLRLQILRVIRERTGLHEQFALPIASEIIQAFWRDVAGERVYVPVRDPDLPRKVVAEFNGSNRDELLAKYDIDRATFYRYLQRARRAKAGARQAAPRRDEFSL